MSSSRGCSNTWDGRNGTRYRRAMRVASVTADRELPPSMKKWLCRASAVVCGVPSASCQSSASSAASPSRAGPPSPGAYDSPVTAPGCIRVSGCVRAPVCIGASSCIGASGCAMAPGCIGASGCATAPDCVRTPCSNSAQTSSVCVCHCWRQRWRCSLPLEVFGMPPGWSSAMTCGDSPVWALTTAAICPASASGGTRRWMLREISAATPTPSCPSNATAKAATRPLRTSSSWFSMVCSMSCGYRLWPRTMIMSFRRPATKS